MEPCSMDMHLLSLSKKKKKKDKID